MLIKIIGGIVAVVVIAVVVAGVAMWRGWLPVPGPLLALLVGAEEPEYSARFYPPDTLAYAWFTLTPGGGQFDEMRDIWGRFNELIAFRDLVDDALVEFEDETDIDFETEIMPWLGPEISVGLLDFQGDIDEPVIVGMAGVRDQETADDFLDKWLEYMEDKENADFDADSYRGIDIVVDENGGQAYALTEDYLVFATSESALELVIERITGDKDGSLADNENFIAARAALPERRFASGYLDYEQAADLWDDFSGDTFGMAGANPFTIGQEPEWLASSAAWVERGIVIEVTAPLGIDAPLVIADLPDPAKLLPDDTLGFMAGTFDPDVDHWRRALRNYDIDDFLPTSDIDDINYAIAIAEFAYDVDIPDLPELGPRASMADVLDLALDFVDGTTGIDLERDLFDRLAGEAIVAVRDFDFAAVADDPARNAIDAVAMLSYRAEHQDALAETLDKADDLLLTYAGLDTDTLDVGADDDATVLDLGLLGLLVDDSVGYKPGYVLHDGYLTLGSTVEMLATIVGHQNGAGRMLADEPEYRRAVGHLPGKRQFSGYVDLHGIIRQLDANDLDIDYDQYRIFSQGFGALAVSGYAPHCLDSDNGYECEIAEDADVSRYTAVLTLFPE